MKEYVDEQDTVRVRARLRVRVRYPATTRRSIVEYEYEHEYECLYKAQARGVLARACRVTRSSRMQRYLHCTHSGDCCLSYSYSFAVRVPYLSESGDSCA